MRVAKNREVQSFNGKVIQELEKHVPNTPRIYFVHEGYSTIHFQERKEEEREQMRAR